MDISVTSIKVINFIIHAFIAFLFLTIMFIFVISWQEEEKLQEQINQLLAPPTISSTPNELSVYDIVLAALGDISVDTLDIVKERYSEPNTTKIVSNNWLLGISISTCVMLMLIPATIVLTIRYSCGANLRFRKTILAYNALVVVFVLSFEIYFIFVIGTKYIPINPEEFTKTLTNNVKEKILEELRK